MYCVELHEGSVLAWALTHSLGTIVFTEAQTETLLGASRKSN